MKKATVSVSGSIELFYDETEIQTTLEEYRECMDKDASLEDRDWETDTVAFFITFCECG